MSDTDKWHLNFSLPPWMSSAIKHLSSTTWNCHHLPQYKNDRAHSTKVATKSLRKFSQNSHTLPTVSLINYNWQCLLSICHGQTFVGWARECSARRSADGCSRAVSRERWFHTGCSRRQWNTDSVAAPEAFGRRRASQPLPGHTTSATVASIHYTHSCTSLVFWTRKNCNSKP